MRNFGILGVAAALALIPGAADAARWCHSGPNAKGCVYGTEARCVQAARRTGGSCHVEASARRDMAPGQIYPSRPYWAAPGECYTDDGYGRFRPCSAGDGGDGGLQ